MSLRCDVVVDPGIEFVQVDLLSDLVQHAATSEPALDDSLWQMTVRLTDDDAIASLHEQFFADPSPTDVITFPSGDESHDDGAYLGDVVVSVETAEEQAIDAGHSPVREVAFLVLHGLLHLCGYDDATEEQRKAMHKRQHRLLEQWERLHGGRPW